MGFRGKFFVSAVVLFACVACTNNVAGTPRAGDVPPPSRESSQAPAEPTEVTECTTCDEKTIVQAIEHPVVKTPKRVGKPPSCELLMPLSAVSQIVGANATPGVSTDPDECHAWYDSPDFSRNGQAMANFNRAPDKWSSDLVDSVDEFEGNTLLSADSARICTHLLAIDDPDDQQGGYGTWLRLEVNTYDDTDPCPIADQILELVFQNLPRG